MLKTINEAISILDKERYSRGYESTEISHKEPWKYKIYFVFDLLFDLAQIEELYFSLISEDKITYFH